MNVEERVAVPRENKVSWYGPTTALFLLLWTGLVFFWGYDFGKCDVSDKQSEIDVVAEQNAQLKDLLEGANLELIKSDMDKQSIILEWEQRHADIVKENKRLKNVVPPSKCVDEEDYYGTEAANEFNMHLDILKKWWLRGQDN